jgi:hypothetical protein
MLLLLQTKKASVSLKALTAFILLAFGLSTLTLYITRIDTSYASVLPYMEAPTKLVGISPAYIPVTLRGLKFHPEDPFKFTFILDEGDYTQEAAYSQNELKQQAGRLLDYFFAALPAPAARLKAAVGLIWTPAHLCGLTLVKYTSMVQIE